jgi:hypothetical protein
MMTCCINVFTKCNDHSSFTSWRQLLTNNPYKLCKSEIGVMWWACPQSKSYCCLQVACIWNGCWFHELFTIVWGKSLPCFAWSVYEGDEVGLQTIIPTTIHESKLEKQMCIIVNLDFPRMYTSLDYMHYHWKNCPLTWQRHFSNKNNHSSIILEVVAN